MTRSALAVVEVGVGFEVVVEAEGAAGVAGAVGACAGGPAEVGFAVVVGFAAGFELVGGGASGVGVGGVEGLVVVELQDSAGLVQPGWSQVRSLART
jgi:hypothetical protein